MENFFSSSRLNFVFYLYLCMLSIAKGVATVPDSIAESELSSPVSPVSSVLSLISRVTPSIASNFTLVEVPTHEKDYFRLSTIDDHTIKIEGNNGVSLASGYNYYLKNYLNSSISWTGDNLKGVEHIETMPPVHDQGIHKTRHLPWSYYINVCTHSYSMVWWDWARWQREIDWMAMRGINMPLMLTGQEFIWVKTFEEFGLTLEDLDGFFPGPAFLAWQRMGNIKGWAGPLPVDWIHKQFVLGKKIFLRMRELGMKPVLPTFAGHVPERFHALFPQADIHRGSQWVDFEDPWSKVSFVEPTDPLYGRLTTSFISNLINHFGPNDHLYNGDQFNENPPSRLDGHYLREVSFKMMDAMKEADPEAVWILQGWMFHFQSYIWGEGQIEAYLAGVENDRMIILDLWSELHPVWKKTKKYFGKNYIWCELLNFGGQQGMGGSMRRLMADPFEAAETSSMVGIGLTMEGIMNNAVMFDLMLDQAWMKAPVPVKDWLYDYIAARYGARNKFAEKAWDVLESTVYNRFHGLDVPPMIQRPGFHERHPDYNYRELFTALRYLLKAAPEFGRVASYRHDVVDLTRQVLSDVFTDHAVLLTTSFRVGNSDVAIDAGHLMVGIISDMEKLLATNEFFLLGTWIRDAQSWATSETQMPFYQFNAKNQITRWGPRDGTLNDYAGKQWSGMVGDYYHQRWSHFVEYLEKQLTNGKPFDMGVFYASCSEIEHRWQQTEHEYPTEPNDEDPIEISQQFISKYKRFALQSSVLLDEFDDLEARSSSTRTLSAFSGIKKGSILHESLYFIFALFAYIFLSQSEIFSS